MSVSVFAQDLPVTGTVIDDFGEPVLGANVVVKGTANGATTYLDGNFTFRAPKGSTIVISFIGYKAQEVVLMALLLTSRCRRIPNSSKTW